MIRLDFGWSQLLSAFELGHAAIERPERDMYRGTGNFDAVPAHNKCSMSAATQGKSNTRTGLRLMMLSLKAF